MVQGKFKVYKDAKVYKENLTRQSAVMILENEYRKAKANAKNLFPLVWGNGLGFNLVTTEAHFRIEEQKA